MKFALKWKVNRKGINCWIKEVKEKKRKAKLKQELTRKNVSESIFAAIAFVQRSFSHVSRCFVSQSVVLQTEEQIGVLVHCFNFRSQLLNQKAKFTTENKFETHFNNYNQNFYDYLNYIVSINSHISSDFVTIFLRFPQYT